MNKLIFLILVILFISIESQKKPPKDKEPKKGLLDCKPLKRQSYQCTWQSYDSCCNLRKPHHKKDKTDKKKPPVRERCRRLTTPKECNRVLNLREKFRIEKELKKEKLPPTPPVVPDPDDNGR